MRIEVERLLVLPLLEICWLHAEEFQLGDVFDRLVVVKLISQGKDCATLTRPSNPRTLAATHITDGVILPFVELDVDSIHWLVGHSGSAFSPLPHAVSVGRALGRVLAHELYHVLAETRTHAGQGIAKPAMDCHDLVWSTEGFQATELARMWTTAFRQPVKE